MHGLKTIGELNELAVQNANAKKALEKAQALHESRPSPLTEAFNDAAAKRETERQSAIDALTNETIESLISRVDALEYPSTLEVALRNKLAQFVPVQTLDEGQ